jgi:MoaA/NifB/PqqE/SkfB family radical SAM enzyme
MEIILDLHLVGQGDKMIESPVMAQWDITTGCNFSCSFCLTNSGKRQVGELPFDKAKIVVDRLYSGGILFLRILGGEPFFRKDIVRIMQYAASKGMLLSFSTNASLIDDYTAKALNEMQSSFIYFQVSLYGVDKDSYMETTKNKKGFHLVTEGIRCLIRNNLRPYAFWVLTPENIKHMESAYRLVQEWGFPALRISPKLNLGRASEDCDLSSPIDNSYWRSMIESFVRLNSTVRENGATKVQLHARPFLGEYLFKKTGLPYFYITCKAAVTMVYVDPKGDASPCPFAEFMPDEYRSAYKSNEKLNILEHSLNDVWQSGVFMAYRNLQNPDNHPNRVFKSCPHLKSGICNPCIYTPCTCRDTIKMIKKSKERPATRLQ